MMGRWNIISYMNPAQRTKMESALSGENEAKKAKSDECLKPSYFNFRNNEEPTRI